MLHRISLLGPILTLLLLTSGPPAQSKEKPFCSAYSVGAGDLYLKITLPSSNLECWTQVLTQGEQHIAGGNILEFRYATEMGRSANTVLVVKERVTIPPDSNLYPGSPSVVDTIRLYRPKIIASICNDGQILEA